MRRAKFCGLVAGLSFVSFAICPATMRAEDPTNLQRATYFQEEEAKIPASPSQPPAKMVATGYAQPSPITPPETLPRPLPPLPTVPDTIPLAPPFQVDVPGGSAAAGVDGFYGGLLNEHNAYADRMGPGVLPVPDDFLTRHGLRFFLDAGLYFWQPYFQSHNPAFLVSRTGVPASAHAQDFGYDIGYAPRIEFGLVHASGWGMRADWTLMDEHTHLQPVLTDPTHSLLLSSIPLPGIPGFNAPGPIAAKYGIFNNGFAFSSHLKLNISDIEFFKELCYGDWRFAGALGVRYVYVSQDYEVYRFNSGTNVVNGSTVTLTRDSDQIAAGHNIGDVGPTLALEIWRPIGATPLVFYTTLRTSAVFGEADEQAYQQTRLAGKITPVRGRATTLAANTTIGSRSIEENTMQMEDLEVGLEWVRQCGRARWFMRTGFVAQIWLDAGDATNQGGDLGFLGLALTAGVAF